MGTLTSVSQGPKRSRGWTLSAQKCEYIYIIYINIYKLIIYITFHLFYIKECAFTKIYIYIYYIYIFFIHVHPIRTQKNLAKVSRILKIYRNFGRVHPATGVNSRTAQRTSGPVRQRLPCISLSHAQVHLKVRKTHKNSCQLWFEPGEKERR